MTGRLYGLAELIHSIRSTGLLISSNMPVNIPFSGSISDVRS